MNLKSIGGWLFILGVGSIGLHFAGLEFRLLSWIDSWGEEVAWAIRAGFAVVGGALWFLGRRNESAAQEQGAK